MRTAAVKHNHDVTRHNHHVARQNDVAGHNHHVARQNDVARYNHHVATGERSSTVHNRPVRAVVAQSPASNTLQFSTVASTVQPKADCACGGGCPRCAAKAIPVSQPGDTMEREADLKAEQVLRKVDPQALANITGHAPQKLTQLFGSYFNADFSEVRLHTNNAAAVSAKALGARAFTVGSDIAFASGQFAPHTAAGQKLLAHELAHVEQQRHAPPQIQRQDDGGGLHTTYIFGGVPDFLDCSTRDLDNDQNTPCCSSTTRALIPAMYDTSREYIGRAITRMESGANMDGAIQANFGAGAATQRAEILARLKRVQAELGKQSQHIVRCRIALSVRSDIEVDLLSRVDRRLFCAFNVLATGVVGGNVATICVNAQGQPAGGWSTLLHEMVHLSGVGDLPDRDNATQAQMTSGEFETYHGETTYPNPNNFALRNADSYATFVNTVGASSWTPEANPARFAPTLDVGGVMSLTSQPRFGVMGGMQWTPFGSNLQAIVGARAIWLPRRDDEAAIGTRPTDLRAYAGAELGLRWIGGQGNVRFILDVAGGGGPYVDVAGNVDPALAARLGAGVRVGGPSAGFGVSADVMRLFHFDSSGLVGTSADDWLGGLVVSGHWGGTSTSPR